MPINKILAVFWRKVGGFYTNLSANIVTSKVKEMDTVHTFSFSHRSLCLSMVTCRLTFSIK
ncbi:MAG TPA: hypothetical protein DIT14_05670 [Enterococcus faecalis]|nr:hypothetical protein [Enterococcus faecalis]